MLYYGFIILAVLMFGGCFFIKDIYMKKRNASDVLMTFESMFIGSIVGLLVLFILNGFKLEFTWFTFIMVVLTTLNNLAFTYCSFKALKHINLSLFSLYTMLGGMLLPFFQGIFFYNETLSIGKIICVILIFVSLLLTIKKGNKNNGYIYYVGIFILNGMSGVLSKIFLEAPLQKTSVEGYSILLAIVSIILSAGILFYLVKVKKEELQLLNFKTSSLCVASGVLDKVANYLLVFALLYVDSSVQYPMVTGGVMIVSTINSYFTGEKPTTKEIISVIVAFIGLLILLIF
jgi:drug/metabolite transporter (DMT)-like permease